MSLILEALKKSEAERRLGRAPDLLTPALARAHAPRTARWVWWLVAALSLALLLALAGWARMLWWPANSAADVAATAADTPAQTAAAPASNTAETRRSAEPAAARSPAPARPAPARRTAADASGTAIWTEDADFSANERESVAVPAGSQPPPVPRPVREPASPPPVPAPPPQTAAPLPPPAPSLPASAVTTLPAAPAPVPAPAPPPAPTPVLEPLQHLATLPAAQREGLPPLRLSMHVYDQDPAARFVLIDGKRYRQGDVIANGVVVDEIRPDGVAIARSGQRFLIARP